MFLAHRSQNEVQKKKLVRELGMGISAPDRSSAYKPVALYFESSDYLEYVRDDVPCVHRRIDDTLTLILSMDKREIVGFRLKGFRHFYLKHFAKTRAGKNPPDFVDLVNVIEIVIGDLGEEFFQRHERRTAYEEAKRLAFIDKASLSDLPRVA